MCNLSEIMQSDAYTRTIRSVRISGYVTSVGLEEEFWATLDELAGEEKMSRGQLLTTLYDEYLATDKASSFTSFLRVLCVAASRLSASESGRPLPALPTHDGGVERAARRSA